MSRFVQIYVYRLEGGHARYALYALDVDGRVWVTVVRGLEVSISNGMRLPMASVPWHPLREDRDHSIELEKEARP